MANQFPAKNISCTVANAIGLEAWPTEDFPNDPFWAGGTSPRDYMWQLMLRIEPQHHSSIQTPTPFYYDGRDVQPGMFVASLVDGLSLKIVSIVSQSAENVVCIVEDTYRFNTFNNNTGNGVGIFSTPTSALLFDISELGLPIVPNSELLSISNEFLSMLFSRFIATETGAGGSGSQLKVEFDQSLPSFPIGKIQKGTVQKVTIVIEESFANATISVGTSDNPSRLVQAQSVFEHQPGLYIVDLYEHFSDDETQLIVFVNGNQGSGKAIVEIEYSRDKK